MMQRYLAFPEPAPAVFPRRRSRGDLLGDRAHGSTNGRGDGAGGSRRRWRRRGVGKNVRCFYNPIVGSGTYVICAGAYGHLTWVVTV